MEKIILSKEKCQALIKVLTNLGSKELVLKKHAIVLNDKDKYWKGENYRFLNDLSLEEMALALYCGYEVEESKEEKLLAYVEELKNNEILDRFILGQKLASVETTLRILGIKIKGINE